MEIRRILKDKDGADTELSTKDIEESFKETLKLLKEDSDDSETEINFDKDDFDIDDEEFEDDSDFFSKLNENTNDDERLSVGLRNINHPLIDLTNNLFNDFFKYYDFVKAKYPAEIEQKKSVSTLQQNLDVLAWFTPQIHVKSRMCIWGKNNLEKVTDDLQREIDEDIQNVNCRIAVVGIEKVITAASNILQLKPDLKPETKEIISQAKIIKDLFVAEFPNTLSYKRPYFD